MNRVLLLEPAYKGKFPPVGLMKLAYYHNHHRGDFVWFAKGRLPRQLPQGVQDNIRASAYYVNTYGDGLEDYLALAGEAIAEGRWDRVYVTTLFTFAWDQTVATIEYAKTLVDDPAQVMVGGVAATLMPWELERATGIKPIRGLLHDSSQLGDPPGVCIDTLTPDYSILEQTEYKYAVSDGYFLTATRGCGNRCSFCAVQTLEPEYQDYIPILPRIENIRRLYGEKRNLYLMDNNILRSADFPRIIEEIKAAGFARGATRINPASGKPHKRIVDINSGLDSKFLTEEKARLLGEIALDPAHIAFDHIGERDQYINAVRMIEAQGVNNISSFLLYNTKRFSGKGSRRDADTPKDLYDRMRINYELNCEINQRRDRGGGGQIAFDAFAFPMKFIPLNARDRSFVGDNWTPKLLAGVRAMFEPSRGGVFVTPGYFEYMYGDTYQQFYETMLLPYQYVRHKGKPVEKYPGEHPNRNWLACIAEWRRLYHGLTATERSRFEGWISDNRFTAETFRRIRKREYKLLYLHYLTGTHLPTFLEAIDHAPDLQLLREYILYQCPAILWCTLEILSKLKTNEKKGTLLRLLFSRTQDNLQASSF